MRHTAVVKLEGGVSCVWERTSEIASWEILEFWRSERGNDVVAGQWLDNDRKVSPLSKPASRILCSNTYRI
jgi:hypothetical protein